MEASTPSSSITPSKLPCIYQLGSSLNPVLWGFYGEFLTLACLIQSLDISNGFSPPWGQEDRTKSLNPLITGLVPLATCLYPEVTQGLSKTHHINITKDILLLSTPKSLTKIKYIFIINQCHTSWMLLSLIVSEKKKTTGVWSTHGAHKGMVDTEGPVHWGPTIPRGTDWSLWFLQSTVKAWMRILHT